ncbi:MAG: ABC transporter permease [Chloroflexi bacterium]|nr:MAG: ABC transporter permease [Chloroflexota bacterium]
MGFLQPFMAMMERDFRVLKRDMVPFMVRTAMQPFLFVFVFTYVQPKIGAGAPGFQDVLVPGLIASSVIFQGIQAVAIPLVMEFSQTREIEDRVMAPLPVWGVALQKMTFAFLQSMIVVAVVFPLVYIVPVNTPKLHISILALITVIPLGAFLSAAMGLLIGTAVNPRQITLVFALIVMPLTFLGAVYYPWSQLEAIRWLQVLTLLNPLVYMSEGLRGALTPEYGHMSYWAVYGGLIFCCAACTWGGIRMFSKRVLS